MQNFTWEKVSDNNNNIDTNIDTLPCILDDKEFNERFEPIAGIPAISLANIPIDEFFDNLLE